MSDKDILDPRKLTFSQAYGYKELPQPLKLEDVPKGVRTKLWNLLYENALEISGEGFVEQIWCEIFYSICVEHYGLAVDEFLINMGELYKYKDRFMHDEFHELFDLLLVIMRHRKCPKKFIRAVAVIFRESHLAYVVDESRPVTIYPVATKEQGEALLHAIAELNKAGSTGPVKYLRQASDCINQGDHAGAVRESFNAVESAAWQFEPIAKTRFKSALMWLEKEQGIHPALMQMLSNLHGFASKPGIRHAQIDGQQPNVGQDEAILMLGACASFSSYLIRKHRAQTS